MEASSSYLAMKSTLTQHYNLQCMIVKFFHRTKQTEVYSVQMNKYRISCVKEVSMALFARIGAKVFEKTW